MVDVLLLSKQVKLHGCDSSPSIVKIFEQHPWGLLVVTFDYNTNIEQHRLRISEAEV